MGPLLPVQDISYFSRVIDKAKNAIDKQEELSDINFANSMASLITTLMGMHISRYGNSTEATRRIFRSMMATYESKRTFWGMFGDNFV